MINKDIEFFLYTKTDCSACDSFKSRLHEDGIIYQQINIETDLELKQRYGARIPVLVSSGIEICEGTYNKQLVLNYLSRA